MGLLRGGDVCEKSINFNSLSAIYFGIKITLDLSNSSLCMQAQLLQSCLTLCDPMNCKGFLCLLMGFFWQEYQSGLPRPPPGDLPDPAIKPMSPVSWIADRFFTSEPPGKSLNL